ncbi:MAG: HIT family protein [Betaproteobacteria bacterium]|nr:HIT family protein [Betaproteobacteria bacterium]
MARKAPENPKCLFCSIPPDQILIERPLALAKRDGYPVSKGHTLIIPRRHVESFFGTTEEEQREMLKLLDEAKAILDREHKPDGYNIGINNGAAAGQTVMHLHIHLIPRYAGDAADARGGVRWIFPDKAAYWKKK